MSIELPVLIEKVVFKNERGFAVLAAVLNPYSSKYSAELEDLVEKNVKSNKYNNFTVTTTSLNQHEKVEGGQFLFVGNFVESKFGKQFKSEFYFREIPSQADGLLLYLQEELPNIGPIRSKEIMKKFGFEETIRILNEEPMKLAEINGITESRVPPIKNKWDEEKGKRDLYIWLMERQVPPSIGSQIYKVWKNDSLKIIQENPYRLSEDVDGVGFKKADYIAYKVMKEVPKLYRLISCMHFILKENLIKNSNLCMPYSELQKSVIAILKECTEENSTEKFVTSDYVSLFTKAIKENLDKFVAVKNIGETSNGTYIYLSEIWEKEKYIATELYHRGLHVHKVHPQSETPKENPYEFKEDDLIEAEKDVSVFSKREIKLDECQKEAIKSAFENKITVITGPAGSGKSMISRCIYHGAEEKHLTIRMMSPTGRAARVLKNKTGFPAETIHRSLKMQPGDDFPKESIKEDLIIIDEFSMVGLDTIFAIFCALEENSWAHVVIIGDKDQIPSISPGNFLSDIMNSGVAKVIVLTKIHRQDENSYVALLANDIAKGKVVEIPPNASDIKWHDLNNQEPFDVTIKKVVKEFISENSIDDLQIIAPMYRGEYGINKINEAVQNLMFKENEVDPEPFIRGFHKFFIRDRVIQTKNNYSSGIFNGDIGSVVEAGRKITNPEISDEEKDFVTVNFYGENITYFEDEIDQLKLAWAISIHRFQGSQSPYIFFVFSNESRIMASKEILYTGMTRCEKHLDIYGHKDVFRLAPTKSAIKKRYTNMNNIIKELKENRKILEVLEAKEKK